MNHTYWNPGNETLSRDELRALQHLKLKRLCEWAREKSVFHRRRWEAAGFHPDQLKSVDDIRRIPFMTREEWMEAQLEAPPFGTLTTVDRELAVRYHMTSGTTGRTALRVLDSTKDWEWIAEMWAYGLWGFGLRPKDVVLFAFSYGTFIGFWGAHYACEKIGCLVLPSGSATTEGRVRTIVDMGVTAVCSTPTYALRMWQAATAMGIFMVALMFNFLAMPAISIPCGLVDDMPVGLQLVGLPDSEPRLLQLAQAFLTRFPKERRPVA